MHSALLLTSGSTVKLGELIRLAATATAAAVAAAVNTTTATETLPK
jgi:hypothetical protein